MAKFVVFAKRLDINETNVRVFCMTDDKEEKTLEVQEHYTLVAKSRDVEVLDGQALYLEFAGNLEPAHLSTGVLARSSSRGTMRTSTLINEQLGFIFRAFYENRLALAVRLRDVAQEPTGRIAFMEDSLKYLASLNAAQRAYLAENRRRAVCTLGVRMPPICVHYDNILGTPKRNSYYASARIGDLTLADIASELNGLSSRPMDYGVQHAEQDADSLVGLQYGGVAAPLNHPAAPEWVQLAPRLGIPRDEVEFIAEHCATSEARVSPALLLLMHWYRLSNELERDQDLARALLAINRPDLVERLNFVVEPKRISRSTMELLQEIDRIPVRSTENLYGTGSELGGARSSSSLGHHRTTGTTTLSSANAFGGSTRTRRRTGSNELGALGGGDGGGSESGRARLHEQKGELIS